jgi:hypothetical protein
VAALGAIWFRVPPWLNAGLVNSDAAIVGLQGLHMMKGELEARLWGSPYQASLDPLLAGLSFALFGTSPRVLYAIPVIGMALTVLLVFDILRKKVAPVAALLCVVPLMFGTMAINTTMVFVLRQTMILVFMAGIWLLDGASISRRPRLRFAAGCAVMMGSVAVDYFALVMVPAGLVFVGLCCVDEKLPKRELAHRIAVCVGGVILGFALVKILGIRAGGHGVSAGHLATNLKVLWEECLPIALGQKVILAQEMSGRPPWTPPTWLAWIQRIGGLMFLLSVLVAPLALFVRRLPWSIRRLAFLGGAGAFTSVVAVAFSRYPLDGSLVRYLAPLIWLAPFVLLPFALYKRFALVAAPFLVSVTLGGWFSYGTFVDGVKPVVVPQSALDEERMLGEFLREQKITHGAAEYWLSYRLSLLFEENPILAPLDVGQDRYAPYRAEFDAAKRIAAVFHPNEPRAMPEPYEAELKARGARYERAQVGNWIVFLVDR